MDFGIIRRNYDRVEISQRIADGYINLTAMAQANGKLIADYLRLDSTKADVGIPISDDSGLVQVRKGGNNRAAQGTWGHPQVAIHCGQWSSPAFAVQVSR